MAIGSETKPKTIAIRNISEEVHRAVKIAAINNGVSMSDWILSLILKEFEVINADQKKHQAEK